MDDFHIVAFGLGMIALALIVAMVLSDTVASLWAAQLQALGLP
jgi:hypothetical protein